MAKAKAQKLTTGPQMDDEGFEIIGGDNTPLAIGEVVEGTFGGVVRMLPGKGKNMPACPVYQIGARTVLGNTVLKSRIEEGKVKEGDFLKISRLADAAAKKGRTAAKLFDVRVKRAS